MQKITPDDVTPEMKDRVYESLSSGVVRMAIQTRFSEDDLADFIAAAVNVYIAEPEPEIEHSEQ